MSEEWSEKAWPPRHLLRPRTLWPAEQEIQHKRALAITAKWRRDNWRTAYAVDAREATDAKPSQR